MEECRAFGCSIGGTLAWLTNKTDEVKNTFTVGNIDIDLTETFNKDSDDKDGNDSWEKKMVPGWTLSKDPKVTVDKNSEDCWLFIKVEESSDPKLDDYIAYAIAEDWKQLKNGSTPVDGVYYRKITGDSVKGTALTILGAGSWTDTKNTTDEEDDVTYPWNENKVLVKPTVTKAMMDELETEQPTLTFTAYAVQLYRTGSDGTSGDMFDEYTAWTMIR